LKTRISSKLLAAVAGLFLMASAFAQPPDGGPTPPDGQRPNRERIETVIIGKFSSELNLTPEQAEKFFPRFRQLRNSTEEMMRGQRDRRDQLDVLSQDPKADQTKVNTLVEQNSHDQEQMLRNKQEFLKDVSSFLTPQQVSRCSILLDELPQRIRQYIEEHRDMRQDHRMGPPADRQRSRRGY
jgi:Spy/CpxP family protein refolding chaperone